MTATDPDTTYLLAVSLGQGNILSDQDFDAFMEGETQGWSIFKKLRTWFILSRPIWRYDVDRWRRISAEVDTWYANTEELPQ